MFFWVFLRDVLILYFCLIVELWVFSIKVFLELVDLVDLVETSVSIVDTGRTPLGW